MIELFISALALGFLFNAVPGAIFTESLRRGLQGGFKSALYVQFGSLVGDLTWAVLGLGGAAVLFEVTAIKIPLAIGICKTLAMPRAMASHWLKPLNLMRDGCKGTGIIISTAAKRPLLCKL